MRVLASAGGTRGAGAAMTEHAVVIAGGGPTGMMLAGELTLAGIDVVIVERRTSQDLDGSRAGGLHSRTIEVLDQRGIADRFLAEGGRCRSRVRRHPVGHQRLPHPSQLRPRALAATSSASWPAGSPSSGSRSVVAARCGIVRDDTGADVELSDHAPLRAEYLVGCDGGRSVVRRSAGIDFPGLDPSTSWMIAEVAMTEEPQIGMRREGGGIGPVDREKGGGPYRVVVQEQPDEDAGEPTLQDLREGTLSAPTGWTTGCNSPTWISRFIDATAAGRVLPPPRARPAGRGRRTRTSPAGRPGPQRRRAGRRVNLGWKLAQVVDGTSPRASWTPTTPNGIRSVPGCCTTPWRRSRSTAPTTVTRPSVTSWPSCWAWTSRASASPRCSPVSTSITTSARDTRCSGGACRTSTCTLPTVPRGSPCCTTRPVLLNLGAPGGFDISPWANRVRLVDAKHVGAELPVLGEITAPSAVLIRPDGHVAWAGELPDPELSEHLRPGPAATPA